MKKIPYISTIVATWLLAISFYISSASATEPVPKAEPRTSSSSQCHNALLQRETDQSVTSRALVPLVYESTIQARFRDLDAYGHVNASVYIDLLVTSRFEFGERVLNISFARLASEEKLGFYITNININYLAPIVGLQNVIVRSAVHALQGKKIINDFEIVNSDRSILFANGSFEIVPIDLKVNKPIVLPQSAEKYFFENPSASHGS